MRTIRFCGVLITVLALLILAACQAVPETTYLALCPDCPYCAEQPNEAEAADDLVVSPGGYVYRGNVFQEGVVNPWPHVDVVSENFTRGSDIYRVTYRNSIETRAGETRNNLVRVARFGEGGLMDSTLSLYVVGVYDTIALTDCGRNGGLIGTLGVVLSISVAQATPPGEYAFDIGIEIDGEDYGTFPCTLTVVE